MDKPFEKDTVELGFINPNSSYTVEFIYKEGVNPSTITVSCGCATPLHYPKKRLIKVTYKTGDYPVHLIQQNQLTRTVAKLITVKYTWPEKSPGEELSTSLWIKATIKAKL